MASPKPGKRLQPGNPDLRRLVKGRDKRHRLAARSWTSSSSGSDRDGSVQPQSVVALKHDRPEPEGGAGNKREAETLARERPVLEPTNGECGETDEGDRVHRLGNPRTALQPAKRCDVSRAQQAEPRIATANRAEHQVATGRDVPLQRPCTESLVESFGLEPFRPEPHLEDVALTERSHQRRFKGQWVPQVRRYPSAIPRGGCYARDAVSSRSTEERRGPPLIRPPGSAAAPPPQARSSVR
jgi:hypothetical protein